MSGDVLEPGSVLFVQPSKASQDGKRAQWWQYVKGANWYAPGGPGSSIAGKENHPVVHVAYEDALAYAQWRGHALPTEAQWEYAARGGRGPDDDWTMAYDKGGKPLANSWQGVFPVYNTEQDGYARTAPVGCFPPNAYGLYDMIGNVWELTSDWVCAGAIRARPAAQSKRSRLCSESRVARRTVRLVKGHQGRLPPLFTITFARSYRPTARQPQEADLSAGHVGFRTVTGH